MEFLFDDTWIDRGAGVRRVVGSPRKRAEPVFDAAEPWERGGVRPRHALFYDEEIGRYRFWYATGPWDAATKQDYYLCYAESADGIVWERPEHGLVEFDGSTRNNIVQPASDADGAMWNVVKDTDDPDESRRYKALGFGYGVTSSVDGFTPGDMGVCIAFSPDGLRWTEPHMVIGARDMTDADFMLPIRDPATGTWVAFMRPRTGPKRRFIGYSTSDDFEHWSDPRMLLTPDAGDDEWMEFYGLTANIVAGWRVACLWVYHNNPEASPMTTELAFSRNGRDYSRAARGVEFLPLGADGDFDSRMILPLALDERGDEVRMFYQGWNREHGSDRGMAMQLGRTALDAEPRCAIGMATLPWGHFCGLRADHDGVVETKWLCNYGTAGVRAVAAIDEGGYLRAELLDQYGAPIPGWGRDVSDHRAEDRGVLRFSWNDPSLTGAFGQTSPDGGSVGHVAKVRFHLHRATLFGFQIGDDQ